jgi:hypothetical protein
VRKSLILNVLFNPLFKKNATDVVIPLIAILPCHHHLHSPLPLVLCFTATFAGSHCSTNTVNGQLLQSEHLLSRASCGAQAMLIKETKLATFLPL